MDQLIPYIEYLLFQFLQVSAPLILLSQVQMDVPFLGKGKTPSKNKISHDTEKK